MLLRINNISVSWSSYTPAADNADIAAVVNESIFSWGINSNDYGSNNQIAVRSVIPPIKVIGEGTNFKLLRFRFNRGDTTGVDPTQVTAQFIITTNKGDTTAAVSLDYTNGTFSINGGFPQTIAIEGGTLTLLGFLKEDKVRNTFSADINKSTTVYLSAQVTSLTVEEPTGPAVFNPKNCIVPYVAPITDFSILNNCDIPAEIEPIVDCPAIDLPAVAALGTSAISSEVGPPGPPGNDGVDGCDPIVTTSYEYHCVYYYYDVKVIIDTILVARCWTHIHFNFYLYCPYDYYAGCCRWVWCPCDGETATYPPVDNNCPKTSTCTSAPGHWVPIGTCEGDPPCIVGQYYGQTETVCPCPDGSSSSSPAPTPVTECCTGTTLANELYISVSGAETCPPFNAIPSPLLLTKVDNCWKGNHGLIDFTFCCVFDEASGNNLYRLTVAYASSEGCVEIILGDAASCDPFIWQQIRTVDSVPCCDAEESASVPLVFTVYETGAF